MTSNSTTTVSLVQVSVPYTNLNNDLIRYKWMIRFHIIDALIFLIRFIILCTDIAAVSLSNQTSTKTFLVFILILEIFGSLPILLANILYAFVTYMSRILYETDDDDVPYCPRKRLLRLATLTCFTCDCYYEHPHAVLLTRLAILSISFLLRFAAFIIGAVCANRYPPRTVAYTVMAALSFIPTIMTMILEYRHHRRLWKYFPDGDSIGIRFHQHIQFIPYSIINDQRTSSWRSSLCKRSPCVSRNLYHILLYHSGSTQFRDNDEFLIGFHQTNALAAYGISRKGFKGSDHGMLGPGVYFATCFDHTEFKANYKGVYICARIRVGNLRRTKFRYNQEDALARCDTVYYEHSKGSDEFCVRDSSQIEEWIVVVNQDDCIQQEKLDGKQYIFDCFHGETYQGCIF